MLAERAAQNERPLSIDEQEVKLKLVELSKTSKVARDALTLIGALEERVENVLLTSGEELTEAEHDIEDHRRLVVAIEEIIQARLTRAYTAGHANLVQIFEEVARDIAVAKADLT